MPGFGNVPLMSSLTLTRCPNLKLVFADSADSGESPCHDLVKTPAGECNLDQGDLQLPSMEKLEEEEACNGDGIKVLKRSRGSLCRAKKAENDKGLMDHVKDWVEKKVESEVPESQCFLPFLVGSKKMVECLACHKLINPGEELLCTVRGCQGTYHSVCAKDKLGISNLKKFKCPQHECFVCKQRVKWRCVRCPVATHDKHAPWPDEVIHLESQPGSAVCWKHPMDWRLDRKVDFFFPS